MIKRKPLFLVTSAIALCVAVNGSALAATIDDFNSWTLVQDPPHPGMTATLNNATQATLSANGAVPAGVDVGYQSVNASDVANASAGNYFSASEDFQVAIDFDVSALNSVGLAGIGFGIGEDGTGMNSAGPGLLMLDGTPLGFGSAARINDVTQGTPFGPNGSASGRFFVSYESISGDITFGVNTTLGSASPSHTGTFSGLQNSWTGDDLLVSFFLRSDAQFAFSSLSAGSLDAVFSNFEVLAGTPVAVVPLPAGVWLLGSALGLFRLFNRRRS